MAFTHITFDVGQFTHPCVERLLSAINVTRVMFSRSDGGSCVGQLWSAGTNKECSILSFVHGALQPQTTPRGLYDLCFIDGDHTFLGVTRDFLALCARFRWVMFHDVVDINAPGVPTFWAAVKAGNYNANGSYVAKIHECVSQPKGVRTSKGRGLMGLGILEVTSPIPSV
ncbi:hypothetical protein T492DRAFT_440262 [Pavlovales sp. CCMP2436]|nr:hypothetical protein T492DRAFT_440262 [Pavlovales sp. CCMP2436]|mmetsp:Transcript_3325/g.8313  ORF Transcript_3325/g.8313 Transcript_3325/m.8313 type:complete len:170 (+) Transcript_3325:92-601(+)